MANEVQPDLTTIQQILRRSHSLWSSYAATTTDLRLPAQCVQLRNLLGKVPAFPTSSLHAHAKLSALRYHHSRFGLRIGGTSTWRTSLGECSLLLRTCLNRPGSRSNPNQFDQGKSWRYAQFGPSAPLRAIPSTSSRCSALSSFTPFIILLGKHIWHITSHLYRAQRSLKPLFIEELALFLFCILNVLLQLPLKNNTYIPALSPFGWMIQARSQQSPPPATQTSTLPQNPWSDRGISGQKLYINLEYMREKIQSLCKVQIRDIGLHLRFETFVLCRLPTAFSQLHCSDVSICLLEEHTKALRGFAQLREEK